MSRSSNPFSGGRAPGHSKAASLGRVLVEGASRSEETVVASCGMSTGEVRQARTSKGVVTKTWRPRVRTRASGSSPRARVRRASSIIW